MTQDIRLETERLILREIEESDWESIHRYGSDPAVVRFLSFGPNTEDETREFVDRVQKQRVEEPRVHYQLGLVLKPDDTFIGAIGIWVTGNPESRNAEIGYCMRQDYWGQGYMTEAARAVVAFGFRELGMHRIHARVDPDNTGSRRVLEKIGMRLEGHLIKNDLLRGEWRDTLVMAVLLDEWRAAGNQS